MDPVEITGIEHHGAKRRIDQALTGTDAKGERAPDKVRNRPLDKLTFKTVERDEDTGEVVGFGLLSVAPEYVIGVGTDSEGKIEFEGIEEDEAEEEE
jgi:hypothetical protein